MKIILSTENKKSLQIYISNKNNLQRQSQQDHPFRLKQKVGEFVTKGRALGEMLKEGFQAEG